MRFQETGHALSVGWADDAPVQFGRYIGDTHGLEVYSGNDDANLTGGVDGTPERVVFGSNRTDLWSIMKAGKATPELLSSSEYVYLFSIEELATADTEHIPSKEDD